MKKLLIALIVSSGVLVSAHAATSIIQYDIGGGAGCSAVSFNMLPDMDSQGPCWGVQGYVYAPDSAKVNSYVPISGWATISALWDPLSACGALNGRHACGASDINVSVSIYGGGGSQGSFSAGNLQIQAPATPGFYPIDIVSTINARPDAWFCYDDLHYYAGHIEYPNVNNCYAWAAYTQGGITVTGQTVDPTVNLHFQ
jgi:hypothetical protein